MIRLLGAIMIAGASLAIGLGFVAGEAQKLKELRSLIQLLKEIRGELGTRSTPLPQLMELMGRRCSGSGGRFAMALYERMDELGEKEFSQLWRECIQQHLASLEAEDRDLALSLGLCLGRYELDRQLSELDICIELLENRLAGYSSRLPEKRRVGLGLACSLGALLLIVLI